MDGVILTPAAFEAIQRDHRTVHNLTGGRAITTGRRPDMLFNTSSYEGPFAVSASSVTTDIEPEEEGDPDTETTQTLNIVEGTFFMSTGNVAIKEEIDWEPEDLVNGSNYVFFAAYSQLLVGSEKIVYEYKTQSTEPPKTEKKVIDGDAYWIYQRTIARITVEEGLITDVYQKQYGDVDATGVLS